MIMVNFAKEEAEVCVFFLNRSTPPESLIKSMLDFLQKVCGQTDGSQFVPISTFLDLCRMETSPEELQWMLDVDLGS